ncbi:MAG TPA: hypothetical protein VKY73_15395 [Polyangiaceae bacterium]|nr:hypothetical protein [Polyangiaceae bacterium]
MDGLEEQINGLPNISGSEEQVDRAIAIGHERRPDLARSRLDFGQIDSAFAIGLHMHQPLIPAGGDRLETAELISNLQHMMNNQHIGDNHNAPVFVWCYKRMGEFIPALVQEGKNPRVMLEYSGTLLWGMQKMGLHDVFENLRRITMDPDLNRCVEWLGAPWGHAVAPSTPVQDYRMHVRAFQHHFASLFGLEAVGRLRGFSPSEMALPNHPDVAYAFVKTLKDAGYQWVLVQEHTVEHPDTGRHPTHPHFPHRLVCRSSKGETASIIAIVKTQGSDTKLVAQMQPYFEARGLSRKELKGKRVPPLVTQISDGENGGVMMNEFPPKYMEIMRESSGSRTPALNVSEYLDYLGSLGLTERDFPELQPLHQKRIWERMKPGDGPERLEKTIDELRKQGGKFHVEGGSWTNDISWVRGYESVLGPMERVSSEFAATMARVKPKTSEHRFRNALFHLMAGQTSCYRYWGEGVWTDYGKEILRRASEILKHDF